MEKQCFKCKETKPLNLFYRHGQMGDGHLNKCIECTKKDVTDHRNSNIEKIRAYDRARGKLKHRKELCSRLRKIRKKRFPQKELARNMVSNAVRDKRLEKKHYCEKCGRDDCRILGHHEDYYKPLEVIWMCQVCHAARHKEINNAI